MRADSDSTASQGGYGVNQRGDAFSRANQTGGAESGSHFSGGNDADDDDAAHDASQPPSGATTPGGPFRGASLSSFPGLPQRDYDADAQRGRDATEAARVRRRVRSRGRPRSARPMRGM